MVFQMQLKKILDLKKFKNHGHHHHTILIQGDHRKNSPYPRERHAVPPLISSSKVAKFFFVPNDSLSSEMY